MLLDAAVVIAAEFDIPLFWVVALVDPATTFILTNAGC